MNILRFPTILILASFALVLTACRPSEAPTPNPGDLIPDIVDQTWRLEAYGPEESPEPVIANSSTTLILHSDERGLGGNAGCNQYGGSYLLRAESLLITQIANTEMFCMEPEGIMDQEQKYLSLLVDMIYMRTADGQLILSSPAGNVLIFSLASESNP
jgi:heat shock protein HslJ